MRQRSRNKKAQQAALTEPKTIGYQGTFYPWAFQTPRDLPLFDFRTIQFMKMEPTIQMGLAIRASVLQAAEFAYKKMQGGKETWVPGVQAQDPVVAAFVLRQLNRIWQHNLDALLSAQEWGWAAAEVTCYLTPWDTVEIDKLLPAHAYDTKALTDKYGSEVKGVQFLNVKREDVSGQVVNVRKPWVIWHAYLPEARRPYGQSALIGAYSPWADKWLNGGALDVRRLFMMKDAYGGCDIGYPNEAYPIQSNGGPPVVQYGRDIARQIVEQLRTGGVTTFPSGNYPDGTPKWVLKRATMPGNPQHILQYPKDLDIEMLRGLVIPDDVLTSTDGAGGAWAGKQVPMMAFYQGLERWLRGMVADCVEAIRPLVELNFGEGTWFEVTTKPLAKQAQEQQQQAEKPEGGEQPGGDESRPPGMQGQEQQEPKQDVQKMSLESGSCCESPSIAVTVEDVVRRARKAIVTRMSLDDEGHDHAPAGGTNGGQFTPKPGSTKDQRKSLIRQHRDEQDSVKSEMKKLREGKATEGARGKMSELKESLADMKDRHQSERESLLESRRDHHDDKAHEMLMSMYDVATEGSVNSDLLNRDTEEYAKELNSPKAVSRARKEAEDKIADAANGIATEQAKEAQEKSFSDLYDNYGSRGEYDPEFDPQVTDTKDSDKEKVSASRKKEYDKKFDEAYAIDDIESVDKLAAQIAKENPELQRDREAFERFAEMALKFNKHIGHSEYIGNRLESQRLSLETVNA